MCRRLRPSCAAGHATAILAAWPLPASLRPSKSRYDEEEERAMPYTLNSRTEQAELQ